MFAVGRKWGARLAMLVVLQVPGSLPGDTVDHFRKFKAPPDEARILALAGIREFRCDYETMPANGLRKNIDGSQFAYQQDVQLFAEEYEGTSCIARHRLAVSVNAFNDLIVPLKGIFSFGWNGEKHELVSAIDNGQLYTPWTTAMTVPDFSCVDGYFFEDSTPERRASEYGDFEIYPVLGLCGNRNLKINYGQITDAKTFLQRCERAHAENALLIYLYKSRGGDVPLKFDRASSMETPMSSYHLHFPNWLLGTLVIVVVILVCALAVRR